jgi:MSHA biogenesis protein MshM
LSKDDLEFYVAHRLRIAGYSGSRLFSRDAISALKTASGGIPRLANILAHKALLLTYGEGKRQVRARHVSAAAKDTIAARKSLWRWIWTGAIACIAAGASIGWTYFQ